MVLVLPTCSREVIAWMAGVQACWARPRRFSGMASRAIADDLVEAMTIGMLPTLVDVQSVCGRVARTYRPVCEFGHGRPPWPSSRHHRSACRGAQNPGRRHDIPVSVLGALACWWLMTVHCFYELSYTCRPEDTQRRNRLSHVAWRQRPSRSRRDHGADRTGHIGEILVIWVTRLVSPQAHDVEWVGRS